MREVKLEIPNRKQAMEQSRCLLPRSSSEIADPPSPFSSNPAHHPVSVPTTPGLTSSSSFARMFAAATNTDTPPITPKGGKPKPTPAAAAAAYYASLWSPRRLMQRAARAFRTSRSRRFKAKDVPGEERASVPASGGKVYDAAAAAGNDGHGHGGGAATLQEQQHRHGHDRDHPESVPAEKIIHVANHHHHHHVPPPLVLTGEDECGKTTTPPAEEKEAAPAEEEAVESPKKAGAPATAEDVADKFVTVVKEAIKKHEAEQQQQDEKKEAMRRFQGSRVKTAMEARPESEQPRRREAAPPSNDVIEEARSKLLEKRHSRVRALVGAFETVMDANKDAATAAKPQHHYRKSV